VWSRVFWLQAAERAVKAFAYALLGLLGGDAAQVLTASMPAKLSVAAGVAFLSLLGSIVSAPLGPNKASPSLVPTTEEQARRL
jgi:hypothetical protein